MKKPRADLNKPWRAVRKRAGRGKAAVNWQGLGSMHSLEQKPATVQDLAREMRDQKTPCGDTSIL
jgi:hypothetical protein